MPIEQASSANTVYILDPSLHGYPSSPEMGRETKAQRLKRANPS
jgi:hypothetical protein